MPPQAAQPVLRSAVRLLRRESVNGGEIIRAVVAVIIVAVVVTAVLWLAGW
jgi:hypothetical protein